MASSTKKSSRIAFRVAVHAMERFRERVDEAFIHRTNDDLANVLNERLRNASLVRDVEDPRATAGLVTTLYRFECRTGETQVAVVRENCVVTVLEEWMALNNYPGWDGSPTASLGTLGSTAMASKLRSVVPVAPAPAPSDEYLTLAAECRTMAAKTRDLRDQKAALEAQLAVITEQLATVTGDLASHEEMFVAKRERLLVLMADGGLP